MNKLVIQLRCDEPESALGRVRRARAYLERVAAGPTLFPNPEIEENPLAVAYFDIEYRAKLVAQRKARQNQ